VGDVAWFAAEFEQDVLVIAHAVRQFGLPANLKLSVHSGSDKFAIYPPMHAILARHHAGVHLKTAGTTWLEEIIGLAAAGGEGLALAKRIYRTAHGRVDELCAPYASVIDIDRGKLPAPAAVDAWDCGDFTGAVTHDQSCPGFNPHMRQLLHVGFKAAAELGEEYLRALDRFEETVAQRVSGNLFERHMRPLFLGT
jgi:tagaturonate epimerase